MNILERKMAEKTFLKWIWSRVRQTVDDALAFVARESIRLRTKVEKDKVIFMHYNDKYECNPAYICDEIVREKLPWDVVYALDKKSMAKFPLPCPEGVRVVRRNSLEFFYELAGARIIVDNAMCIPKGYFPKKQQVHINTWHGSMGLKRIDADKMTSRKWVQAGKKAGKVTDYMISNSEFETEVYRSTYWKNPKVQILEYGHPRNDILFCEEEKKQEIHRKVCDFFQVEESCHFLLYAPTFRDEKNLMCYDIDYGGVLAAAAERFGGEWKIINRYHFKVASALTGMKQIKNHPDILAGNRYPDIQELMVAADIGITDYSSWICDYVLTGKPAFIYANDLSSYDGERGFYYPLESTPFAIAETNEQLLCNIRSFDEKTYAVKREQFLADRGCKEQGDAAKKVVALMKTIIETQNK